MRAVLTGILMLTAAVSAQAAEFAQHVPMEHRGASTFYVDGAIEGFGETQFLVDTGAGYTTINQSALEVLKAKGTATYLRDLRGVMADGSRLVVPLYMISGITIGNNCAIQQVEAAVFPGTTRFILGLNALGRVSPFVFSMEPPSLRLSGC